jgi:hypothetical protein
MIGADRGRILVGDPHAGNIGALGELRQPGGAAPRAWADAQ